MIESAKEMLRWYATLSSSVKVITILVVITFSFGIREYKASNSEKELLKDTINNERTKLELCEEDKKTLYNYLIDFEYKDKKIDSLKKF